MYIYFVLNERNEWKIVVNIISSDDKQYETKHMSQNASVELKCEINICINIVMHTSLNVWQQKSKIRFTSHCKLAKLSLMYTHLTCKT